MAKDFKDFWTRWRGSVSNLIAKLHTTADEQQRLESFIRSLASKAFDDGYRLGVSKIK